MREVGVKPTTGSQISDVAKKSRRRFFAVFGLQGPSAGPGTVKKRLRMKSWSWGKPPGVQDPFPTGPVSRMLKPARKRWVRAYLAEEIDPRLAAREVSNPGGRRAAEVATIGVGTGPIWPSGRRIYTYSRWRWMMTNVSPATWPTRPPRSSVPRSRQIDDADVLGESCDAARRAAAASSTGRSTRTTAAAATDGSGEARWTAALIERE